VIARFRVRYSVPGGQTQTPTSPREYMDLRARPESPEQVEWIHLWQRLHWIEVCPTSQEKMEQGNLEFWANRGGARVRVDNCRLQVEEVNKEMR